MLKIHVALLAIDQAIRDALNPVVHLDPSEASPFLGADELVRVAPLVVAAPIGLETHARMAPQPKCELSFRRPIVEMIAVPKRA